MYVTLLVSHALKHNKTAMKSSSSSTTMGNALNNDLITNTTTKLHSVPPTALSQEQYASGTLTSVVQDGRTKRTSGISVVPSTAIGCSTTMKKPRERTKKSHERTRPAFEKLFIGPLMIFGEHITGGHYLEVLRLAKQMSVGKNMGPTYLELHKGFVAESGFAGAIYRGFFPWGLIQCSKGIPVLFVQHEANYQLNQYQICSPSIAEKVSGVLGGAAQALFVCPLQKVKVYVIASQDINSMTATQACLNVVMRQGVLSLYDGIVPMMLRRSLDWGIRFGASSEIKHRMIERKFTNGDTSGQLSFLELIGCGLVGGACSAMTHPIDNIITNSQKPLPGNECRSLSAVIKRMISESGMHGFTRGWGIKIVDNAYHMAWMYGVGTVLYDYIERNLHRSTCDFHA